MSRRLRSAAIEALLDEARALSGDFDNLSEVVAERIGLNQVDLLAMDLISRNHGVTAGQLAQQLDLTSGAITGLIDRLERAGFARRAADPKDRRRVIVLATAKEERISEFYAPLAAGLRRTAERYSEKELALLTDFLREMRAALGKSIDSIRRSRA